ncbi:ketose-bisphosphate aldolase [Patescibacteria group bacterium]|nr:ketose-bisphosphate aldolase [Patescibacteria group bacterium]MBU0964022.1 ketose-bisphosphate aldolase [Patescibacteria group bacterium]
MLVHLSELIKDAKKKNYALGAFNIENLETTIGVVRAAVKMKSPVILQVSETSIQYAGLKAITSIVQAIAAVEAGDIPVSLHLDHGKSFRSVAECVRAGFSSIMMDASDMPFTENIILTKQAVDFAHRKGVFAQGELGIVKGLEEVSPEERKKMMTNAEEAEEFVSKAGVDTLAVAVGNVHGIIKMQKGNPGLDLKRLESIHKIIPDTPLVLHGASGMSGQQIKDGIKYGITIINTDTELRLAFTQTLRHTLENNPDIYDPREVMTPSIEAIQKVTEEKMEFLGSAGMVK